jgi:hypothetical protein
MYNKKYILSVFVILLVLICCFSVFGFTIIPWRNDANAGWDLGGSMKSTGNIIIPPSNLLSNGSDYYVASLLDAGVPHTYYNSLITIDDVNTDDNPSDIVTIFVLNDSIVINDLYNTNHKIFNIYDDYGEKIISKGILLNPWGDGYDKLMFYTDTSVWVINISSGSNYNILQHFNYNEDIFNNPSSNYEHADIGCFGEYDTTALCKFSLNNNSFDFYPYTSEISYGYDNGYYSEYDAHNTGFLPYTSIFSGFEYSSRYYIFSFGVSPETILRLQRYNMSEDSINARTVINQDVGITMSGKKLRNSQVYASIWGSGNTKLFGIYNVNLEDTATQDLITYRFIVNLSMEVVGMFEGTEDGNNVFSNFMVGDYNKDGIKELCIINQSLVLGVDSTLLCWRNSSLTWLTKANANITQIIPFEFDASSSTVLMGGFKTNTSQRCLANYNGILCNGTWLYDRAGELGGYGFNYFSEPSSSGITFINEKPYYVTPTIEYVEGVGYEFFPNFISDFEVGECPNSLLNYISGSSNPNAVCETFNGGACVGDTNIYPPPTEVGYYYCEAGYGYNIYDVENPQDCTVCGLYCEISGSYVNPSFLECLNNETCMNGSCASQLCTADTQFCSDGIDFVNPASSGDVYKCDSDGNSFSVHQTCSDTEYCQESTPYFASCKSNNPYYCRGQISCYTWESNSSLPPSNCYNTLDECMSGIDQNSTEYLADNYEVGYLFNSLLFLPQISKLIIGLILIIGVIYLVNKATNNFMLSAICGFFVFMVLSILGFFKIWILILIILIPILILVIKYFFIDGGSK